MARSYHHLTYKQRCQIEALRKRGDSLSEIARHIGTDKSTVSRELRRSGPPDKYDAHTAANRYATTRSQATCKPRKMKPELVSLIEEKILLKWSPDQISGWLKVNHPNLHVSYSTIYKHIKEDRARGGQLYQSMRHGGKKYNKRLNKRAGRGLIPNRTDIGERPAIVEEKSRIGDWEVDTIVSSRDGSGAVVSIVERFSKFTLLSKVDSCHADVVKQAIIRCLLPLKDHALTITSDNGKEFARHCEISAALDIAFYFAKPYHSWERGLNEHTNGLVRQYFPKKTSFHTVTEEELGAVQTALNHRPRRVLGYRTPYEVLMEHNTKLGKDAEAFKQIA